MFPMYVGVILTCITVSIFLIGVPHVCGGDPDAVALFDKKIRCSPCMWG